MHVYILPYEEPHIATAVGLDDFIWELPWQQLRIVLLYYEKKVYVIYQ